MEAMICYVLAIINALDEASKLIPKCPRGKPEPMHDLWLLRCIKNIEKDPRADTELFKDAAKFMQNLRRFV
jgi:hypothetical protein